MKILNKDLYLGWISGSLLLTHLVAKSIFTENSLALDLILFNVIGMSAGLMALSAPVVSDHISATSIGVAFIFWSVGSFASTWNSFFSNQIPEAIADFCYALFYPLLFLGIIRSFTQKRSLSALELLDTVIIAIGFTSVLTAFLLKPAMAGFAGGYWQVFIAIFYPVGDIVILVIVLLFLLLTPLSFKSLLLTSGLISFALSDLFFIWSSLNDSYQFGAITDDGWIIGLFLIAISLYFDSPESKFSDKISSSAATIALIASSFLLGIQAFIPGYFPEFILLPAFITLALAFIRMSFALQEAKSAGTERLLARTDELTGLSNRRNFLSRLDQLSAGYIFLLDLDNFKSINDRYGHAAGDQLLKQVASRFTRVIPLGATLARLGGDEFGVIAQVGAGEASELALALRATLSYPVSIELASLEIAVSIGYTSISPDGAAVDWLRRADLAMYEAKGSGSGALLWSSQIEKIG